MARISDPEDGDSSPQTSSSKEKIPNGALCLQDVREGDLLSVRLADDKNPLADFAFDKLPTELLVEILRRARADNALGAFDYPFVLAQVCSYWRSVVLGAPTLWTDIHIVKYYTEETGRVARIYLERSKTCPIFLTWFSFPDQHGTDARRVINDLIIPAAERWQRITLISGNRSFPDILLTAMESLDFPILQDVEISSLITELSPPKRTLCRNAPFLRRCRFRGVPSFPPLPTNLVVLDYVFQTWELEEFDLDPLLDFLPHVAHSLEHLRFGQPAAKVRFTPRASKTPLENLKCLHIQHSHIIMDRILVPNLTYFVAQYPLEEDSRKIAGMFEGFSAPRLKSIQFHEVPLLPLLTTYNLPSMFPQLESVALCACDDESAFILLLEPAKPKKPSSLKKAAKYPPKHRNVENPFPNLKELKISDMRNWTSLQAAIEKRLKNGDKSLRRLQLPKEQATETIMPHLRRWLPTKGIEFDLYQHREQLMSTPEFQDSFCDEEADLFYAMIEENDWDDDDDDYDYWEERGMFRPDYELPNQEWDEYYDGYDDEEEEEEDDEEDDFYEG